MLNVNQHLVCVLTHIRVKGEVGTVTLVELFQYFFTDRSKGVLFVDHFCYYCFVFVLVILSCLFLAVWERAELLALLCM